MNKLQQNLNEFKLNTKMVVAVIVTLALFLTSGFLMSLCFIAEGFSAIGMLDGGSSGGGSGGGGGGGISLGGGNSTVNKPPITSNSQPGAKTGIVLPCATPAGNYLSSPDENTKNISSDTEIKSGAAVLVDTTGNVVVASKNADTRIYPASMTKVMTLLLACENAKDPNALVTVTDEMVKKYSKSCNPGEEGPSVARTWKAGDQVSVEDILHLIIFKSDTFACWLISEYVSGSEENFVKLMNSTANKLGLTKTNFMNSTGLFDTNHYTTAREMSAIMAAAMNNESAKLVLTNSGYTEAYTVDIKNGDTQDTINMYSAWYVSRLKVYGYPRAAWYYAGNGSDIKIIGGKTGYETIPTNCFVTAGENTETGTTYVCVQIGSIDGQNGVDTKTSTYDTRVIYQKYALK